MAGLLHSDLLRFDVSCVIDCRRCALSAAVRRLSRCIRADQSVVCLLYSGGGRSIDGVPHISCAGSKGQVEYLNVPDILHQLEGRRPHATVLMMDVIDEDRITELSVSDQDSRVDVYQLSMDGGAHTQLLLATRAPLRSLCGGGGLSGTFGHSPLVHQLLGHLTCARPIPTVLERVVRGLAHIPGCLQLDVRCSSTLQVPLTLAVSHPASSDAASPVYGNRLAAAALTVRMQPVGAAVTRWPSCCVQ